MRNLAWFKIGKQYEARFTGFKIYKQGKQRCWNKLTVSVYSDDRRDAIEEVKRRAAQYGYQDVTIDHLARVG